MVGMSARSRDKTAYHYYACKRNRYDKTCDKTAVRRDVLEREVADAIRKYVLKDGMIEAIADLAMERQKKAEQSPILASLHKERADTQRAIDNIMCAIEQGIITPTTRARLQEQEENAQRLDAEIAAQRFSIRANSATREELIASLRLFQRGDIDDADYRAALIDTFVRAVYVFDDKLKIIFHLGNGKEETVTLSSISPTDESAPADKLHPGNKLFAQASPQSTIQAQSENGPQIIAVGIYNFLLICPRQQKMTR